jgi:predicted secreted protein
LAILCNLILYQSNNSHCYLFKILQNKTKCNASKVLKIKGSIATVKRASGVVVAGELESHMKAKQLLRPEDQSEP